MDVKGVSGIFQVLLVDDEESVLEALTRTVPWDELEVETVHVASSSSEALRLLKEHPIDIVLTDIRMPGMSGLDLIKEIKGHWKGTKCILLSGHAEFEYAKEAVRLEAADYLLKPVKTDELADSVRSVLVAIKAEWAQISSFKQTVVTLRENRPLLRSNLLMSLLTGKTRIYEDLPSKLDLLELNLQMNVEFALLLIRRDEISKEFLNYDWDLYDFALCNITEEILAPYFNLWYTRDEHGFLVFVLMPNENADAAVLGENTSRGKHKLIERLAAQLQKSVQAYLNGKISVMISSFGRFPENICNLYSQSLSEFRNKIGTSSDFFFSMGSVRDEGEILSLKRLYNPPTFSQLLEGGRWNDAEEKISQILEELDQKFGNSREHLLEVYHSLFIAFSCIAHQNGKSLSSLIGEKYIENHLSGDVSLNATAGSVYLHPVYLSKVFKSETGETLSDYIYRLKMEKAAFLLKNSGLKIYEIATAVGYENTYFMKLFKKCYMSTPQEYRESQLGET